VKTEVLLRKLILVNFKQEGYVKVSTIVVKPTSASASDVKVALEKAEKAYARLSGGEKWDDVLLSVTEDPRARASQGQVGWRPLALFPESVQKEIASLKKGAFTKPAQTQNGIQIFRIDAMGKGASAEELLELQESYVGGQRQQTMAKLRAEAKVEKF
jgi:parvulin-like peptidyl-prolyl isomerase